jgi:hypothetical protein
MLCQPPSIQIERSDVTRIALISWDWSVERVQVYFSLFSQPTEGWRHGKRRSAALGPKARQCGDSGISPLSATMPSYTQAISNSGETPDNPKTNKTHLDTHNQIYSFIKYLRVNGKAVFNK